MQSLLRFGRRNVGFRLNQLCRFCGSTCKLRLNSICAHLSNRSLLKVTGWDAKDFLQGLITNDINVITASNPAGYAMLLNSKGRVLYDVNLYLHPHRLVEDCYLLECDVAVNDAIEEHFKFYKLRSKVDIENIDNQLSVWWLRYRDKSDQVVAENKSNTVIYTEDPRLQALGERFIIPQGKKLSDFVQDVTEVDLEEYNSLRMELGICEGSSELITGVSLPLECNLDYLDGVKFDKGCYLGQELTARTYHTGVIRKRLMPIILSQPIKDVHSLIGSTIHNKSGKNCGKLRAISGTRGLALLRIRDSLSCELKIKNVNDEVNLTTRIPDWWPRS